LPEAGKKLKALQNDKWVSLEVLEEYIDVKFFGVISARIQEVSMWVYKKMARNFETEKR